MPKEYNKDLADRVKAHIDKINSDKDKQLLNTVALQFTPGYYHMSPEELEESRIITDKSRKKEFIELLIIGPREEIIARINHNHEYQQATFLNKTVRLVNEAYPLAKQVKKMAAENHRLYVEIAALLGLDANNDQLKERVSEYVDEHRDEDDFPLELFQKHYISCNIYHRKLLLIPKSHRMTPELALQLKILDKICKLKVNNVSSKNEQVENIRKDKIAALEGALKVLAGGMSADELVVLCKEKPNYSNSLFIFKSQTKKLVDSAIKQKRMEDAQAQHLVAPKTELPAARPQPKLSPKAIQLKQKITAKINRLGIERIRDEMNPRCGKINILRRRKIRVLEDTLKMLHSQCSAEALVNTCQQQHDYGQALFRSETRCLVVEAFKLKIEDRTKLKQAIANSKSRPMISPC